MGGYATVFAVAAVVTWLTTPLVRRLSIRFGAVVQPDERRVHAVPTPTLGGVAMYFGLLAAMGVASRLPQFRDTLFESSSQPLGVVLGATAMAAVGFLDDLRDVSAPAKLAGQVLAAMTLYWLGVTMLYFRVPLGDILVLSADFIPLVTVIWVAVIANAINLIDGLDGLAAGIVAIAAGAFFLYGDRLFDERLLPPDSVGPLVAAIACGVCVGFLPHNIHPARIFMGDTGALLLGLLMAASTMVTGGQVSPGEEFSGQTYFFFAPLFIPFLILGVPILDTLFAVIRRAARRSGVATADKEHLHHRLMRLGHGQRRAVFILWAWTAILSGAVLLPTYTDEGNAFVPFAVAGLAVLLFTLFHPGVRRGQRVVEVDGSQPRLPLNGIGANGDRRARGVRRR